MLDLIVQYYKSHVRYACNFLHLYNGVKNLFQYYLLKADKAGYGNPDPSYVSDVVAWEYMTNALKKVQRSRAHQTHQQLWSGKLWKSNDRFEYF